MTAQKFDELYILNERYFLNYALTRIDDPETAPDICSEVYISCRARASIIIENTFVRYIFQSIHNLARDKYRRSINERKYILRTMDDMMRKEEWSDAGIIFTEMTYIDVLSIVESMRETDQELFRLYFQSGMRYPLVCDMLGISITAARHRVHRLRKHIRERMDRKCQST